MSSDDTSAALVDFISNLAKHYPPVLATSCPDKSDSDVVNGTHLLLPGPTSPEKRTLERELSSLAARIRYLEARANTVSDPLPITPGEIGLSSPFAAAAPGQLPLLPSNAHVVKALGANKEHRDHWVSAWLASREGHDGQPPASDAQHLTEEQLGYLRDHVNQQAEQIRNQREHIDSLVSQVQRQKIDQDIAFGEGMEDIGALKRELGKHQQANLAFQKALREIGSIVTAVANGDLSKKVLIHTKEMDPEITTFKRTINKMVDQLQDFASQVTHLAKEVGTEGRLGGQAVLQGVAGTRRRRILKNDIY